MWILPSKFGVMDGTVVQWLAPLTHSKKVLDSYPVWGLSVFACSPTAWVLWLASASNLTTHNKVFRRTIWWDPGTSSNYSPKHFSLVSGFYQWVNDESQGLCDWGQMCWTILQWKCQNHHCILCVNNMQIKNQLRLALCIIMIRKSDEEELCKLDWLRFLCLNASNKYRTGDVTHYSISNCKTTQWMC